VRLDGRIMLLMCRVDGVPRGAEQGKTDLHVEPASVRAFGRFFRDVFHKYDTWVARALQLVHQGVRT
jgi:hypothetical protein